MSTLTIDRLDPDCQDHFEKVRAFIENHEDGSAYLTELLRKARVYTYKPYRHLIEAVALELAAKRKLSGQEVIHIILSEWNPLYKIPERARPLEDHGNEDIFKKDLEVDHGRR